MTARRWSIVLALVLMMAAGGGATGALTVASRDVKDGSLRSVDVARGTIRGVDVKAESLTDADFAVPPGGPQGPRGDQGGEGQPGDHGLVAHRQTVPIPHSTRDNYEIPCSSGLAVNGGMRGSTGIRLLQSAPRGDGGAWTFGVRNDDFAGSENVEFYVTCATQR